MQCLKAPNSAENPTKTQVNIDHLSQKGKPKGNTHEKAHLAKDETTGNNRVSMA